MARLCATVLFAALASAEYTTTVWMSKFGNTDKYGYVASVIGADAEHVTMQLDWDSNTNKTALNLGDIARNYTFGPSLFMISTALRLGPETTGDPALSVQCTQPPRAQSNDNVQCTQVNGDGLARFWSCNEYLTTHTRSTPPNTTSIYPHTYGTGLWGSSGVENITSTIEWPERTETTTPAWCTSDEAPASALTIPYTAKADQFAFYQVVVTAGEEKLSAYSGSSVALSTITGATGTVPGATASAGSPASASPTASAPPESTGAAGKINAVIPTLAGVGIAAVMGLL